MDEEAKPRLRHYRVFLFAIGLLLVEAGDDEAHSPNYVAFRLLQEAEHFTPETMSTLESAFGEAAAILFKSADPQGLLFRFGQIVLCQKLDRHERASEHAAFVIEKENKMISDPDIACRFTDHGRFLESAVGYFTHHSKGWKKLLLDLDNPTNDKNLSKLKELIIDSAS